MQRFCFDLSDQQEYRIAPRPRRGVDAVSRFERIELELLAASSIMETDAATLRWQRIAVDVKPTPARPVRVGQRPALAMVGLVAMLAIALGSIVSIF